MSKLIIALRRKYRTPQDAIRALGLDSCDLEDDLVVGDSKEGLDTMTAKTIVLTRKAAVTMGALVGFLKPKLAADAKLDWAPLLGGLTAKNFKDKKKALVEGIKTQTKGHLAKDANIEGLVELIDALEGENPAEAGVKDALETDPNTGLPMTRKEEMEREPSHDEGHEELKMFLKGKGMADEDIAKACAMAGGSELAGMDETEEEKKAREAKMTGDTPPDFKGMPKVGGEPMVTKKAMDEAISKATVKAQEEAKLANDAAIKAASEAASKNAKEIRDAENVVRPWVGNLAMAHDSAEAVYRTALGALGVKVEGVHPSALKTILELQPLPGARKVEVAMDAAGASDFAKRNPYASKIQVL